MLTQSYMPLQEDGLVDMQATSDKINSVSVFLLSENYEFHWREINFKAWRPVAPCSVERLGVRSAPPRAGKRPPDACSLESHPANRPVQPTAYYSRGVVAATAGFPIPVCASSVARLPDTWA